ncbi:hypothetical protein QT196_24800 [Streptomyces sp. P9-2B-2]|uniref:hypothetical protein n=1 Tax=Streptomyces sp. P9-2B-2 TaxID=3057114 RepID=UPI0025B2999D|nr:hypothetical protein [Streptomyces sp. P9-2B-2]WJY40234.1 hypothetical protein QT196_24800 [Streptomyces sp. P9-2B-2]
MTRGGQARWNNETQRWEDGTPPPAPYTGPMPPRPSFTPSVGGPEGGGAGDGGADVPPSAAPPADPPPAAAPRSTYPYPHPSAYTDGLPGPAADPYRTPEAGAAHAPGARHRTGLVAGAAVAVIVAAVGGGYLLWSHDDDPAAARPAARTQSSAPSRTATGPSTGAPDSPTPAPTLSELPDGFRLAHDKKNFTLAVPGTWTRSERKNGVFYTAPDDRGLVQIFEITDPEITPREALQQASQERSAKPGYEEISLEPLGFPGPGIDANQLVYAYDNKQLHTRVKVVDCAFTATDGRQFAVLVLGAEDDWPQQEQTQEIALRTFVPHT